MACTTRSALPMTSIILLQPRASLLFLQYSRHVPAPACQLPESSPPRNRHDSLLFLLKCLYEHLFLVEAFSDHSIENHTSNPSSPYPFPLLSPNFLTYYGINLVIFVTLHCNMSSLKEGVFGYFAHCCLLNA